MPRAPVPISPILRSFLNDFTTKIAPLELAEKWDNVGFLIETHKSIELESLRILTCIDLTAEVALEAERKKCNMILSYHPVLFKAVHSLSLSQNGPILRCLDANISVFSPHTALDSTEGGMNDFICDIFRDQEVGRDAVRTELQSGANIGRISRLKSSTSLTDIITILKRKLDIPTIRFVCPTSYPGDFRVSSIGVCVGSGASVLSGAPADLYLTGEMSHHEILSAKASGKAVVLLDHSSSERPYLSTLAARVAEFDCVECISVSEADTEPIRSC